MNDYRGAVVALMLLASFCFQGIAAADPSKKEATAPASPNAAVCEKVLIVVIYDRSCKKWCEQARPVIKEMAAAYGSDVKVLELDAAPEALPDSKEKAKESGVYNFLRASTDFVPLVGFFAANCNERKLIKQLAGPKSRDVYEAALKKALAR